MRTVLALILLAGLGGCGVGPPTHASWAARHGGYCEHEASQARARQAVAALQAASVRNVRVLENHRPGAFAWPSGEVVVTCGLVSRVSDAELAAAIAHEAGHLQHARPGALDGRSPLDDEERADDVAVRLLAKADMPADALPSLLLKLAVAPGFDDATRATLRARARRLIDQNR